MAGHDIGYVVAYALAHDLSDRVARLIVAEIPGPPVIAEGPPLFRDDAGNDRLWHIPFNRVKDELIVNMVRSNAEEFYRYEFEIQGGGWTPPEYAIQYYLRLYNRSRDTLRASFGFYRAWGETLQSKRRSRWSRRSPPSWLPTALAVSLRPRTTPRLGGAARRYSASAESGFGRPPWRAP